MADLTPEVMNALVRLMNGELDLESLSNDDLYALAAALKPDVARTTLHRVLTTLNNRDVKFAVIGDRLGVVESTAARWAKPPTDDRRRPRKPAVDA